MSDLKAQFDDTGTLKQIQQLNEHDDFFHRFA